MLSDEWLPRYRLLENFTAKWNGNGNGNRNGNGNVYDRGDYNSSFALRAVELKSEFANTVDLDETAHNEPSHLDLQCLPSSPLICNKIQFELKVFGNFADVILPSPNLALYELSRLHH